MSYNCNYNVVFVVLSVGVNRRCAEGPALQNRNLDFISLYAD